MKRFFAFVISVFLVLSPTISYANSTWYPQSVVVTGSTAIINAAKQGYRSTISHAPAAAAVGKELVKVGGGLALAYAASELLGAGVDWVMNPDNNSIKYQEIDQDLTASPYIWSRGSLKGFTAEEACSAWPPSNGYSYHSIVFVSTTEVTCRAIRASDGFIVDNFNVTRSSNPDYGKEIKTDKYIPISTLASKVISNAASGHVPSQDVIKTAATADVFSGSLDNKLADNAVPSDAPFDPTRPNDPQATPFDPSSIIAALQSVMSAINNMSSSIKAKIETLLTEMGVMHQENIAEQKETQRVINDGMADVVAANNATGARVGDVVAAIEAIEGNTLDGQVINDAIDRAIAAGNADTASIVAAIEGIEGNTLDGQVINDAVDRVIANDDINAKATQDVVSNSIDEAIEQSHVDAGTVSDAIADGAAATQEAIESQTDAITETDPVTGDLALKFPAFCSWAKPVCDFVDWVREPPPSDEAVKPVPYGGLGDIGLDGVDRFEQRITFPKQCPQEVFSFQMFGRTFAKPIPYEQICNPLEQIAPWLLAFVMLGSAYFILENI